MVIRWTVESEVDKDLVTVGECEMMEVWWQGIVCGLRWWKSVEVL